MLDLKFIRENPEEVKKTLKNRGMEADIDKLLKLDRERRNLLQKAEDLKHKKNIASAQIGKLVGQGEDPKDKIAEMKLVAQKIKEIDKEVGEIDEKLAKIALLVPNIPHNSVPVGSGPEDNVEVRRWGEPSK
ncbi:serine--tRNA ligase, partial [bacterium]|nr:serine--tRNA ligase [bacterium]